MSRDAPSEPPPLGLLGTLIAFGASAIVLLAVTRGLIPWLAARTTTEPILLWLFAGGVVVFAPMLLAAGLLLQREGRRGERQSGAPGPDIWRQRLRFRRMTHADWLWTLAGMAAIGVLSLVIVLVLRAALGPDLALHPPFMQMAPLTPDRAWILALWLPVWILNIMGEEVLWRGVILPRQEAGRLGGWAWLANGVGWLLFHLAFGPVIMLMLAPIALILPWMVQRRANSWIGVVIHAGLNGPGFLAMAFGLV